jgi:phosphomannomutase
MDARLQAWLDRDPDPATCAELQAMIDAGNDHALAQRFAGRISFGTAGLRALMGAGPTRMNRLVVQESTLGLGRYILAQAATAAAPIAVVGFDGRHHSQQFAADAAAVLAGLGFEVHLFGQEIPTPVAGFAVRQLAAAVGVVITASHNPPGYNGYKVYWHNGAQIVAPHDGGIAAAIDAASRAPLPPLDFAAHTAAGRIQPLGAAMEQAYLQAVLPLGVLSKGVKPTRPLRLAYTPLHGVGARFAEAATSHLGYVSLHTVAAQRDPDGAFPTVRFPNPEEEGAMDAVLALAHEVEADIACANDPDADRLAIAVRSPTGAYVLLNGDELGALLGDARMQGAPANAVVATTIVSSRLLGRIAAARGVAYFETLTGFKWIANGGIARAARGQKLIFGYEEALGYILDDRVWDKDGIAALVAVCALTQSLLAAGQSLTDRLEALYRRHGLFITAQRTQALAGGDAGRLSAVLRATPPTHIAGLAVHSCVDLAAEDNMVAHSAATEPATLPRSDVLIYSLEQNARIIVRPSGTEPKIKCYYEVCGEVAADESVHAARLRLAEHLNRLCEMHQQHIRSVVALNGPISAV